MAASIFVSAISELHHPNQPVTPVAGLAYRLTEKTTKNNNTISGKRMMLFELFDSAVAGLNELK